MATDAPRRVSVSDAQRSMQCPWSLKDVINFFIINVAITLVTSILLAYKFSETGMWILGWVGTALNHIGTATAFKYAYPTAISSKTYIIYWTFTVLSLSTLTMFGVAWMLGGYGDKYVLKEAVQRTVKITFLLNWIVYAFTSFFLWWLYGVTGGRNGGATPDTASKVTYIREHALATCFRHIIPQQQPN